MISQKSPPTPTPSMEELQTQLQAVIEQMSRGASKTTVSQVVVDALTAQYQVTIEELLLTFWEGRIFPHEGLLRIAQAFAAATGSSNTMAASVLASAYAVASSGKHPENPQETLQ